MINQLDGALSKIINDYRDLFNIGLHGPDILFYNRPYLYNRINRLGRLLHQEPASLFFYHAIDILKETKSFAQLSYLCGFICHFILDSNCHPFINQIMNDTNISHNEIESEMDRYFMIKDGLDPLTTPLTDHIKVDINIASVISPLFNLKDKQIYQCLKGMKYYDHLLLAPQISKRFFIYICLKISFTYHKFQGLIMNYRPNMKIEPYLNKLENLFILSIDESCNYINEFILVIKNKQDLSKRFQQNFK